MNKIKHWGSRFALPATGALSLFGFAGAAMAQETDVSTGVVTAITATNPQITAVVVAMAGALVLIVAWQLIKRAMH